MTSLAAVLSSQGIKQKILPWNELPEFKVSDEIWAILAKLHNLSDIDKISLILILGNRTGVKKKYFDSLKENGS